VPPLRTPPRRGWPRRHHPLHARPVPLPAGALEEHVRADGNQAPLAVRDATRRASRPRVELVPQEVLAGFKYLEQRSYAVIHFQDWHANGFWSIKAKRLGLALEQTSLTVMTHSGAKWQDDGWSSSAPNRFETVKLVWVEAYAIEHCEALLSPTRYMLDWLSQNEIRAPASVFVTPNAYTEKTEKEDPAGRSTTTT
jgi:hypothetical protein